MPLSGSKWQQQVAVLVVCAGIFAVAEAAEDRHEPVFLKYRTHQPEEAPETQKKSFWPDAYMGNAPLESILAKADELQNSGQPASAYDLLSPLEFQFAGIVRYDYALGISALDSGLPDKATFALERVLAMDPNFAGARLDMARAYFQLGDLQRAKTEFEAVLKQEPPDAARATINKYLQAIEAAERAKRTHYSVYAEASIGRDTNVNNSTNQSQVAIPAFGNLVFTLNSTNLQSADNYYGVATGGTVEHKYMEQWATYAGIDLRKRWNTNLTAFDADNVDARAGVSYTREANTLRLGGTIGQYDIAHIKNRDAYGVTADWKHEFSQINQSSIFGQYLRNRFSDSALQVNDFDLTVLGGVLVHIFDKNGIAIFASATTTTEHALNDRADGNKLSYGMRIGGQFTWHEKVDMFTNAGYQIGNYDKSNAAFLMNRGDRQYDMVLGLNWRWMQNWSFRVQASYTNNDANIPIYSFNRLDLSTVVRREF